MKTWSLLVNPFSRIAETSYKRMVKISTYTDTALELRISDTFFSAQYQLFHPKHTNFLNTYNKWKSEGGKQKGATLTIDQLLEVLSADKIITWDAMVLSVFSKKSPEHTSIFPNGHKPFQRGDKDLRINAVNQLALTLTAYTQLAAVKTDVTNFNTLLANARNKQLALKGSSFSTDISHAAMASATALYSFVGACIQHFADKPEDAEKLFDIESIRDHKQVTFTGTLAANETENIMEHTFAADDEIKIQNTGGTSLYFFLTTNPDATNPDRNKPIVVNPFSKLNVTAGQFGNITETLLMVKNEGQTEGHYKLSLI